MITSYPLQFTIGKLEVTGFGLAMAAAFFMGSWLVETACRERRFANAYSGDIVLGAVIGGIVGAKLWFVALYGIETLLEREGLVWYGGLVGGTIGVLFNGWRRQVPIRWTAQLVAPALAAGYAIGRIGCFLVGDDYGIPSTLPWAVAFPEGRPPSTAAALQSVGVVVPEGVSPETVLGVHPTQLYEAGVMVIAFALLWRWRSAPRGIGWLFGVYLIMAGVERFAIEFLRAKDDRFLGEFTIAQLASLGLISAGLLLVSAWRTPVDIGPGRWLKEGVREGVS